MERISNLYETPRATVQKIQPTQEGDDTFAAKFISAFNGLKEGLSEVGYILVDYLKDFIHANSTDEYIKNRHTNFANELIAVTSNKSSYNVIQPIELAQATSFSHEKEEKINRRDDFIISLEKIKTSLPARAESAIKIQHVINYLNKINEPGGELNVVENAFVSTLLEAALLDLENESVVLQNKAVELRQFSTRFGSNKDLAFLSVNLEKNETEYQHLQHQILLIKSLENQAFLGWNHLANEKKIAALEAHYRPQLQVGYTRSITLDVSIGAAAGLPNAIKGAELEVSANLKGAMTVLWMLDDEGYIAIVKTKEANISAKASADFLNSVKASASINGVVKKGEYHEVSTAREFVTYLLPDLIRDVKHRNQPEIAPYLSRSSTLAHAMENRGLTKSIGLQIVTDKESNNIVDVKRNYDLLREHNDMLRSLTISSNEIKTSPDINISPPRAARASLVAYEGKSSVDASIGVEDLLSLGGSASLTHKHRVLSDDKSTSFCQILKDAITSDEADKIRSEIIKFKNDRGALKIFLENHVKSPESLDALTNDELIHAAQQLVKKDNIKKKIKEQFDYFKSSICDSWKKESSRITLTDTGIALQKMSFDKTVSKQAYLAWLKENSCNAELAKLHWDSGQDLVKGAARWQLLKKFDLVKIDNATDISDGRVMYQLLKQDFTFYTNLHIRIAARGYASPQDEKSLGDFAERYGINRLAKNRNEQVLHRMLIANAYLFSNTKDNALRNDMLDFESDLLAPKFEFDRDYLKNHAYFRSNIDFKVTENSVKAETTFTAVSAGCTFKLEAIHRNRTHTNQLRDGDYLDLKFNISGVISDINAFISSIADGITKDYPPELAERILSDIESAITYAEGTATASRDKAYLIRYFKPNAFGGKLPYKKILDRISIEKQIHIGINGAIPIGVPGISITAGFGYTNSSSQRESDHFSSDTFLYALMFGTHEYAITKMNKDTYDIAANDHWKLIKQQQAAYFRKVFTKYAEELSSGQCAEGSLSEEIDAITTEIKHNINLSQAQKNQFYQALSNFQKAVKMPQHKKINHQAAINSFENLLHAYSAHWLERRANSAYFDEGALPELEKSQTSVQIRLQQDRFRKNQYESYALSEQHYWSDGQNYPIWYCE